MRADIGEGDVMRTEIGERDESTLSGARSARRRVSVTGIAAYFSTVCAAWARLARVSQFLLRARPSHNSGGDARALHLATQHCHTSGTI
jgi:hypothetical protein